MADHLYEAVLPSLTFIALFNWKLISVYSYIQM